MENLLQDIRFAFRMLRRNPGFTVVAVLVLAVGIGANTAIFTVVDAVLLRPLPYPDADRLVMLQGVSEQLGPIPMSYPAFLGWREQKDIFEEVATYTNATVTLTGVGEPEQLRALRASSNLLPLLGVEPALGRGFTAEEEPRQANPVVMLAHSFWQERFHSDRAVLGQKLTLSDRVYTVVGVLPANFKFGNNPKLLLPLRLDTQIAPDGLNFLPVVGKLRRGTTFAQAQVAAKTALPRVQKTATNETGIAISRLQEFLAGNSRPLLLTMLVAVAVVLLIACANTANMLLARAAARQKEIAIRISLGAAPFRLLRQLLTESTLLAFLGGALGVAFAWAGLDALTSLLARWLPRNAEVHINLTVLGFALLLAIVTGIVFGLAPALQAARGNLHDRLKQGGWQTGAASGSQGLRRVLVVLELTFSLVLLAASGLLLRSFVRLLNVDKGFDSDHVLTMVINPSPGRYADPKTESVYLQQIVQRVRTLPGVRAAGMVTTLPLQGGSTNGDVTIEGRPVDPKAPLIANKQFVAGDYISAMHMRLLKGRNFNDGDTAESPKVVVVDQAFARQLFPGQDPIGKRFDVGWGDPGWSEIVGVVADTKLQGLDDQPMPTFYALAQQKPELMKFLGFSLVVRTSIDPGSLSQAINHEVHQLDANQAVSEVQTMETVLSDSLAPRRAPMWLFAVFAGVALFLATIGIYGLLSYYVSQRRQEIGVRMALGAQRADVLRLVLKEGVRLIAMGIAAGLVFALIASRAIASLLYGTKPTDMATLLGVSLLLAILALVACCVPALRATRVDPLVVLRNE
ncbi:MAG: ABC transporter permease [Acidobacteriia bacterium]|nr:ABC transporter permease [Terriglobia bacterium]